MTKRCHIEQFTRHPLWLRPIYAAADKKHDNPSIKFWHHSPLPEEPGTLAYIGTLKRADPIFVAWCPDGCDCSLQSLLQLGTPQRLWTFAVVPMTYRDSQNWETKQAASRKAGNWFRRTKKVMAVADAANAIADKYFREEEEAEKQAIVARWSSQPALIPA